MPTGAPEVMDCKVNRDLASLVMTTPQGSSITLSAERLRIACKCAQCVRARIDQRFPADFPGIAIVDVNDLGYGLNIGFSDGHNRGIYPKSYLLAIAGH